MSLALYSILLLFLALAIGLTKPRSRFWDWVDAIYYPMAVVGVLLLYLESASLRSIMSTEEKRAELAAEFHAISASRPDLEMSFSSIDLIQGAGGWLKLISKMEKACDGSTSLNPACGVVDRFAPITKPSERLLLGYEGPEDVGEICRAAGGTFSELSNDPSLSAFLMKPLAEHFFHGLERGFHDTEFERVSAYIDEVNLKLEDEIRKMIGYLSLNAEEEALMKPIYEKEAYYGWIVMKAFEVCLRSPEEIRSGEYAAWLEEREAVQGEIDLRDEELRDLRLSERSIGPVAKLRLSFWPFVIVLALALKFAKGVAHLKRLKWSAPDSERED